MALKCGVVCENRSRDSFRSPSQTLGGQDLLPRHLLHFRVSGGISPVICFCFYSFKIHIFYCRVTQSF